MGTRATQPTPTKPTRLPASPSLRVRWRILMMVGLNVLVLLVVGTATLITLIEQRQSIRQLHDTSARQVRAAVNLTISDLHTALLHIAALDKETVSDAALNEVINAQPAVLSLDFIGGDGISESHVPDSNTPRDWRGHPAFQAAAAGDLYASLATTDPHTLIVASPGPGTGTALIARVDASILWRGAVSPVVGSNGYTYLVADNGTLMAVPMRVDVKTGADPVAFAVFEETRDGGAASRLYWGLEGDSVIGQAVSWPTLGMTVIVETPLTDFLPVLVRVIGLWGLAVILTLGVGEWLIRRILRTVITPLNMLGEAAHAVGGGDYRYRVRLPANTDRELRDLGVTFNDMIAKLAESQRQLDAYTNEMQEIVDQRARELARKAQQMEIASDISAAIATLHDPRVLVVRVAELIKTRFRLYHTEILLLDGENGRIVPGGASPAHADALSLHDATSSVIAWVASSGETLYVPDVNDEPRYRRSEKLPASRSELALPLKFEGAVLGVLNLEADHRDAFPRDQIEVLKALANEIAVSIHNAQSFRALEQANSDLAQATMHANQANTLKSRFLYNVSQKLRARLDTVVSEAETLLSGVSVELPPSAKSRQRQIVDNGRAMQALIEDMLDLSAIEAGHMQLKLEPITLPPLLEEVTNAARALQMTAYPEHDLAITLDLMHRTEPLPQVKVDIERLRYILINLMSNAVKFTPSGKVVLSADSTDDDVLITVRDTGAGISDEAMRYLFEPFQHQSAPVIDPSSGTGLGLPVARLLAMRHGGDLTVETALNQGTTFTLRLPQHKPGRR